MRAALAGFLLLVCAGMAGAAMPSEPVEYLRAIYHAYQTDPSDKVPALESLALSPRLRKLIAADRKQAHGEVGRLDFDPIIDGQDYKISDVTVTSVSTSPDRAIVDATFHNLDADNQIRYDFVRVQGRWLIDEIRELKGEQHWILSKILTGAPDAFPKD